MTIQQLRYVMEIAQTNSINRAAQNLFISQPALSNAVKELEREIGVVIFERTRKGVSVTADGTEFLRLAEGLLSQMDNIKQRYALQDVTTARFQVSSQHYAFVVEAFVQFLARYENIHYVFNVKETKTLEAIEDVYTRKSSLGVIFLTETNEKLITQVLSRKMIGFHELTRTKAHAFISKQHPLAGKPHVALEELAPYPVVIYAQDGCEHLAEDVIMEEVIMVKDPKKVIYAHDRGTMNNIIANTTSYNIGTGYLIPKIIPDEITSVPISDLDDVMRIGWIHLSNREPTEDVLHFVDLMEKSLYTHSPQEDGKKTKRA